MQIDVPYNWRPRDYQQDAWDALENGCKRMALVWHRRAGKDLFAINWLATQVFQRVGMYWHVLPTYRQGRSVVWEGRTRDGRAFLDHFPEETIVRRRDDEMRLWFANGSQYQVVGAEEPDRLVGNNPIGIVFSEWSVMQPKVWEFLRPVLAENDGFAIFIFTPRGRNHAYTTLRLAQENPAWFAQVLSARDTNAITEEAIDYERRAGMPEELIEQEFYCSFDAALVGSYYGDLMSKALEENRICRVPWEPTLPVTTAWDLGIGDATAIWFFQRVGREERAIDYYEGSGEGFPFYAKMLAEKPYTYQEHIVPHDASVREMGTGKSRLEVGRSLGMKMRIARKLPVDDGINAVRILIPKMWFDENKCARGIEALRQYTKDRLDETGPNNEPMFRNEPKHDWTSHAADAIRTYAVGVRPDRKPVERTAPKLAIV